MAGFAHEAPFPDSSQVLDEMATTGYTGTELGDWGFLPTDAHTLQPELKRRGLELVGALVPWPLADRARHRAGIDAALRTARLVAVCAGGSASGGAPFLILADDNGADPVRARFAGRIRSDQGLSDDQRRNFALGAELVAKAVLDETGLRTVFHHHCAGFVETPAETEELLDTTSPELLGLCFDTGTGRTRVATRSMRSSGSASACGMFTSRTVTRMSPSERGAKLGTISLLFATVSSMALAKGMSI